MTDSEIRKLRGKVIRMPKGLGRIAAVVESNGKVFSIRVLTTAGEIISVQADDIRSFRYIADEQQFNAEFSELSRQKEVRKIQGK